MQYSVRIGKLGYEGDVAQAPRSDTSDTPTTDSVFQYWNYQVNVLGSWGVGCARLDGWSSSFHCPLDMNVFASNPVKKRLVTTFKHTRKI